MISYSHEDLSFESRYLAALPELIQAVEKADSARGSTSGESQSEREQSSKTQDNLQELLNAFQFRRAVKMEFVASAISYRDAISRVSPEEEIKITESLRMSVIRFRQDCKQLEELDRKIEANREKLVEANLDVVWREVKKYSDFVLTEEELFRAGVEGITKASFNYDYTRGYRFALYAKWWGRQNITRMIYEKTGKDVDQIRKEKRKAQLGATGPSAQ